MRQFAVELAKLTLVMRGDETPTPRAWSRPTVRALGRLVGLVGFLLVLTIVGRVVAAGFHEDVPVADQ